MILSHASVRTVAALALVAVFGACSTLPRDGPTGRNVERGASSSQVPGSYTIVDLDFATSERIKALPPRFLGSLVGESAADDSDRIGRGDSLQVSIFEPGGSLFGAGGSSSTGVRGGSQALPPLIVDGNGAVNIPFAGTVSVAGLSTTQAGSAIRRALVGKVANPQVVVAIAKNSFNTVTVLGEVKVPGRADLSVNADRLLDVIAASGGASKPPEDIQVTIQRGGQTFTAPLPVVMAQADENIRLARGDQINLVNRPRRYSTFGALGAVAQTEMAAGPVSLAGAISQVGGLDTNSANARAVLVFRFERPEVAAALGLAQPLTPRGVPVVYRLNLERAEGFFIANNFEIQSEDVLYVPRSGSAELGKFFTLIQTVTRVVYDISVTNSLGR